MAHTTWLHLALVAILLVASAFDLIQRRIPNRLLAIGLLSAVALHLASSSPIALLTSCLAGFTVGLMMFLPLYLIGGMAAGDVKLMATVGAFVGPQLAFYSSLATYCTGGVLALAIVLLTRRARQAVLNSRVLLLPLLLPKSGRPAEPSASVGSMPYAVAIMAGTLLVLWQQHS